MFVILFLLKIILYPFIVLYRLSIIIRNWLYNQDILKSTKPHVFTINVGNLTVGGTGKTPHTEYLIRLLSNTYKTTVLSRGYGRMTKGFVWADEKSDAQSIGDEPLQIFEKYKKNIRVAVCEKRVIGAKKIQEQVPDNELIILDDAFQHRAINPHFNILISDHNRPFYSDELLPFGRLRDEKSSAKRADVVIVSKCPNSLNDKEKELILSKIKEYNAENTPIFFSRINYQTIRNYVGEPKTNHDSTFVLIEGIANIQPMTDYLKAQKIEIEKSYSFPDHFGFSRKTINKIISENIDNQFITTEKDFVKIKPLLSESEQKLFFYLPIEVEIMPQKTFDELVLRRFKEFQKAKSEEKL